MATDGGKTANVNGLALMAELTGKSIAADRHDPLPAALYAGRHRARLAGITAAGDFKPTRLTAGSRLGDASTARSSSRPGCGCAPHYFPEAGDKGWRDACDREVAGGARSEVGLCDVSTLGKIEVVGPDAGAFLDRLYTNAMSTPAPSAGPAMA